MKDEVNDGKNGQNFSQNQQQIGLTQALWNFFSDMKTAIVLLLLLAVASVLGTVIKQNALPQEYVALYGTKGYTLIRYFGFENVYGSTIYKILLSLVGINLTVCSINRFSGTWRRAFGQKVIADTEQIRAMQRSESLDCGDSVDEVVEKIARVMRSRAYNVSIAKESGRAWILATRGRLSAWGPYLTHLSLLVIFLGAIVGRITGFDGFMSISEGGATNTYFRSDNHQEAKLGFRVSLRSFKIEHDGKGNPTSYKSDLAVYEGNKKVAEKVIDVNHPLTYKRVSFVQSDFGLAGILVKVAPPHGRPLIIPFELTTEDDPHGKVYQVSGEPFKQISVGGRTLTVFIHDFEPNYSGKEETGISPLPINPAARIMVNDRLPAYKGMDAWRNLGWLEEGESARYKDYIVSLEKVIDYTGLQVSNNPGLPIVYLGFGLIMAGVFISFYVLHKTIRVCVTQAGEGVSVVTGAASREDPSVFDADFREIREALEDRKR